MKLCSLIGENVETCRTNVISVQKDEMSERSPRWLLASMTIVTNAAHCRNVLPKNTFEPSLKPHAR